MVFLYVVIAAIILAVIMKRGDIAVINAQRAYLREDYAAAKAALDLADRLGGIGFKKRGTKAFMLFKMGYIDDAAKQYNLLSMQAQTKQQKMELKMSRALVTWKQGDLDGAIEMLEGCIEHYPNTVCYGSLGLLYILRGDLEKAQEFNLMAYDYNSDDKTILDNLGYLYYLKEDYQTASEYYETLIKQNPNFPECYYFYAKICERNGDAEAAEANYRAALTKRFTSVSLVTKDDINAELKKYDC